MYKNYQSLWKSTALGSKQTASGIVYVGNRIKFLQSGRLLGIGYYADSTDSGNHVGYARHIGPGQVYERLTFQYHNPGGRGSDGWEYAYFRPYIPIVANDVYVIFVEISGFPWWFMSTVGGSGGTSIGNFVLPADAAGAPNGCFSSIATFNPGSSLANGYPAVDVIFWHPKD